MIAVLFVSVIFLSAFLGNILTLALLRRLSRGAKPTLYQIAIVGADIVCLIMLAVSTLGLWRMTLPYWLAWIVARPLNIGMQASMSSGLILTIAAIWNRLQAIENPAAYKSQNHERRVAVMVPAAYFLGVTTMVHNAFNFKIVQAPNATETQNLYVLERDAGYMEGNLKFVLNLIFIGSRFLSFSTLIALCVKLSKKYQNISIEGSKLTKYGGNQNKAIQPKSLTYLLGLQACLVVAGTAPYLANILMNMILPREIFLKILNSPFTLFVQLSMFSQVSLNFLIYFFLSRVFRGELIRMIKCTPAIYPVSSQTEMKTQTRNNEQKNPEI